MQNKAIRNMNKAPRYYRLDNYYLNQRILKVQDLYELEIAKFMHAHFHNNLSHLILKPILVTLEIFVDVRSVINSVFISAF